MRVVFKLFVPHFPIPCIDMTDYFLLGNPSLTFSLPLRVQCFNVTIVGDDNDSEDVEEIRFSLVSSDPNIEVNRFFGFLGIITILCNENAVRLVGGVDNEQGRVEVCFRQRWESVCANSWGPPEAAVICRQLGITTRGRELIVNLLCGYA